MEQQKLKKSVLIRLKKEEKKDRKEEMQGREGAAKASYNNVPTSPRKMRLVADLIRGKDVFHALNILKFEAKSGADRLEKLLTTTIANWKLKNESVDIDKANLYIKEIFVGGGRMLKRLRPAPQGRGYRVRKRSNHISIVIDSKQTSENI